MDPNVLTCYKSPFQKLRFGKDFDGGYIIADLPNINYDIILLDEATSSLDAESEQIVQNAITNLTRNKTTLVIAHRLSTIHNADIIYVLKNGSIVSSGNHDYLIKNSEDYKSLYQKQLR